MKHQYKTVATYFLSYFLNAGISFLVVSVITHHLTTAEFGIVNLYSAALVLLMPFLSCGTLNTISVEYYRKEQPEFKVFFGHAIAVPLVNTLLFTVLAFAISGILQPILKVDPVFIWFLPIVTFLVFFNEVILTILRNRNQAQLFFFYSLLKTSVESAVTLACILIFHLTWKGRIAGIFSGVSVVALLSVLLLYRWKYTLKIAGWEPKKAIILLSAPFIIERLSVFILSSSDRYFIDHYSGTDDVGLYGLGIQIATIVNLMILSLNNFFYPHIFERLKNAEQNDPAPVRKALLLYLGASFGIILLMFGIIPVIFKLMIGEQFQGASYYAYLITLSFIPWAVYQVLLIVIIYLQLNKYIMTTALVGMGISLGLNFILVKKLGPSGAAFTMMCVYTVMALMLFIRIYNQRRTVLPFFHKYS